MAEKKTESKFGGKVFNPSVEEDSPIRAIFCLKKFTDMNRFDASEDCFILDFNPFETVDLSKPHENGVRPVDESDDLVILSEKGQVACRDYPHSRHLCLKVPFHTTSHDKYCKLILFFISKPDVFKSPNSETYVISEEAKIEDLNDNLQSQAAQQFRMPNMGSVMAQPNDNAAASGAQPDEEEEEIDETGVEPREIDLVMTQAGVSRS